MPLSKLNQGTIQHWLTRAFARLNYGSVVGTEMVPSWSGDNEVYLVDDPKASIFGQATLFGTILLNQARLSKASSHARKFVVEHERGHQARGPMLKGIYFGAVLLMALGAIGLASVIGLALSVPFGLPADALVPPFAASLVLLTPGIIALNLEELAAELHVLTFISEEEYLQAHVELSEYRDTSRSAWINRKIQYTSPKRVVQIHRVLQRIGLR